jgi:ATP-dependent RNA helicase DDX23/PRP28
LLVYISNLPKINKFNAADGPYALILAPVRELVQQIEEEALKFSKFMNIKIVSVYGGASKEQQLNSLREGI